MSTGQARKKKRNYKLCRFCKNIASNPDNTCYCTITGEVSTRHRLQKKRAQQGCGFRKAKNDFISGAPIEMAVLGGRIEHYECWCCGEVFYTSDDDLYCEKCKKAERERDLAKIDKNLDDPSVLCDLTNAIVEQTFRDYVSVLNRLDRAISSKHPKLTKVEELFLDKIKYENYFFSGEFERYNVTNININKMINAIHKAEGFDENAVEEFRRDRGTDTADEATEVD